MSRRTTLLDIGGGIGAIQHELLKAGASSSTGVDASTAYIQAAREEAQRQGHADRVRHHHGDFVEIAGNIQPADIVTLDRVICCYHDLDSLVGLSAQRAGRLYGIIYPHDNWVLRTGFGAFNTYLWLRRNPFRIFVHPASAATNSTGASTTRPSFGRWRSTGVDRVGLRVLPIPLRTKPIGLSSKGRGPGVRVRFSRAPRGRGFPSLRRRRLRGGCTWRGATPLWSPLLKGERCARP